MRTAWSPLFLVALATAGCGTSATARRSEPPPAAPSGGGEGTAAEAATAPAPSDEHAGHEPQAEDQPQDTQPVASQELLAQEQRAYEAAQPVFERYCTKCHTSRGAQSRRSTLRHLNMDSYPFGGHHAHEMGATIRKVLGATGERATMPKDNRGAVRGEELALIVAWTEAFDRSHAAGLHRHEEHGHGQGHGHKH